MRKFASFLTSCLVGLVAGLTLMHWFASDSAWQPISRSDLFGFGYMAFFPSFFLVVLVHELGYIIAGQSVGMKFRRMCVWPIAISRVGGDTRLHLSRPKALAGFAYMTLPDGREPVEVIRRFIAGGPIAGLLATALACAWMLLAVHSDGLAAPISVALFVATLLGLCGSLIPRTRGGHDTDMRLLMRLSKPGQNCDLVVAAFILSKGAAGGVRARDLSEAQVRTLLELAERPVDKLRGRVIATSFCEDRGQHVETRRCAEEAFETAEAEGEKLGLLSDPAWPAMAGLRADGRDAEGAKALLGKVKSKAAELAPGRLLVEACIHVVEGKKEEARRSLDKAAIALQRLRRITEANLEPQFEAVERIRREAAALG